MGIPPKQCHAEVGHGHLELSVGEAEPLAAADRRVLVLEAIRGVAHRLGFEAYIEKALPPSLRHGQIVVVDNLGAHKGERIRELIEERGCRLLYLPPYSPDFNPIEEAFSKIKNALRKAQARTREALIEALGIAIWAVTARDARGYFEHGGYHLPVQLL